MRFRAPALVTAALLLLVSRSAAAVDGVREISQACATTTGCFELDTTGFPVEINAPGSYRLTSNLTLPDGNTAGIRVYMFDVSIDLNGFEIVCPGCAAGTGSGVDAVVGAARLNVRDGTIREVGGAGIDAWTNAVFENVTVLDVGSVGLMAAEGARVSGCIVDGSGAIGINLESFGSIDRTIVRGSGSHGIVASIANVSSSIASGSAGRGISCVSGCDIQGNVASGNGESGIWAFESNVQRNTLRSNEFGITAFSSVVVGNTIVGNVLIGLQGGTSTSYASNVLVDNNSGGAQVALGNPIGLNVCMNDTTCP